MRNEFQWKPKAGSRVFLAFDVVKENSRTNRKTKPLIYPCVRWPKCYSLEVYETQSSGCKRYSVFALFIALVVLGSSITNAAPKSEGSTSGFCKSVALVCGETAFWSFGPGENREKGSVMDAGRVKEIIQVVLPRIEKLMASEVRSWEQLTIEQQEELNLILLGGLAKIDIKKARMLHVINSDEYKAIIAFYEWEKALGGYED
jgi:hypothetical protein